MKTDFRQDQVELNGSQVGGHSEVAQSELHTIPVDGLPSVEDSQLIEDLREALGYSTFSSSVEFGSASTGLEPMSDSTDARLLSRTIGEFELLSEIGRGGMGVVYRARQSSLGRDVAVKIVNTSFSTGGSRLSRFRTETRAIARLNHPNIVPIFAQGEHDSAFYFAMGLIEGCSLATAIRHHPEMLSSTAILKPPSVGSPSSATVVVPTGEPHAPADADTSAPASLPDRKPEDFRHLAGLLADVADGLAHAHDHGVVHRDIKPQNLLLNAEGRMYISDFGLARLLDEPTSTVSGQIMGTPSYLSPEQIRGVESEIDHRTDIYSFGVTLYELLTGRRPFAGQTRQQVTTSICDDEPIRPRVVNRRIPRDLETICLRAMSKNPNRRFDSAHLMADELRRFAAGRPIVTQPPGMFDRALGGVRRHRGAAGIGVLSILTLAIGGGFATQIAAGKRDKAGTILQNAYDQLVYFDYRTPEQVSARIDQAEKLGANKAQLNVVRALMSLGSGDNADAISRLRDVPADSPDAVRAHYMLAWGLWRMGERAESRMAFDAASAVRRPQYADEWFFRGLASHFDRPALAIEAYQTANATRAAQQLFFPQAILHLARAYNQEMYASRSDAMFEQAEAILLQLIHQGHYKAYPYYLLSICERFGGDILLARAGEMDDEVTRRFEAALDWARQGQLVDPLDDRPIAAEAECLERLGLLDEAIAARTRALANSKGSAHCENLHYRWRLYFWTGQTQAAQADLAEHAKCGPPSLFYDHVYPGWVAADSGDTVSALSSARRIAGETPDDAQAILWSAGSLRILGQPDEALELLGRNRSELRFDAGLVPPQAPEWVSAVYDLSSGTRSIENVLLFAESFDQPQKLKAEAYFHAALIARGEGHREQASNLLMEAVNCFDSEQRYTYHAKTLLRRWQDEPEWPRRRP